MGRQSAKVKNEVSVEQAFAIQNAQLSTRVKVEHTSSFECLKNH